MVVRTNHPVAKILRKPDLAGRMISWSLELSEFGLSFEPQGSVKCQHLTNFATELTFVSDSSVQLWYLNVDNSSDKMGGGAGIVLEGPTSIVI